MPNDDDGGLAAGVVVVAAGCSAANGVVVAASGGAVNAEVGEVVAVVVGVKLRRVRAGSRGPGRRGKRERVLTRRRGGSGRRLRLGVEGEAATWRGWLGRGPRRGRVGRSTAEGLGPGGVSTRAASWSFPANSSVWNPTCWCWCCCRTSCWRCCCCCRTSCWRCWCWCCCRTCSVAVVVVAVNIVLLLLLPNIVLEVLLLLPNIVLLLLLLLRAS